MKKKLIVLVSLVLLAGSLLFLKNYRSMSFSMLNQVSGEKAEEVQATRSWTYETDFSCLLCNDTRVPFDSSQKTFYVSLDMQNDQWETMSFMSGQPEYRILFPEDIFQYDKKQVIASGQKFRFIVYTDEKFAFYNVVFGGLPMIDLTTENGMWQENIEGEAVFYNTDFLQHGVKQSEYHGGIRGNTSRMYPKKGYNLHLTQTTAANTVVNNKVSLFGMREDDDWILYAMYNDESKIRDRLCIDLWNSINSDKNTDNKTFGTNLTYVEVFADNRYCGLYGLMEPVDAKQLDLKANDYLYKRKNPHSLNYEVISEQINPYAEVQGFEIKEGQLNQHAWDALAQLAYVVSDTSDKEFREIVSQTMDEESAMRMWLFMQIITGHDQRAKNIFYIAKYERDGYKFYFVPWDMDLTWGNVSVGEVNPLYTDFEMETFDDDIPWETADRLIFLNVNGAADKMQELYTQLRETVLSDENMVKHIEELDHMLRSSGAYSRDQVRWPEGAHAETDEILKIYVKKRLKFLDKALFDLKNYD